MAQPLLKPRWIAGHVIAVVAVVVFVLAGLWQLRRHDEKVELRDRVEAAMEQPVLPIAELSPGAFAQVTASGEYLSEPEYQAKVLRALDGMSGFALLTPLLLDDGSAVLVYRAWMMLDYDVRSGLTPPEGRVDVEGVLWPAQTVGGDVELGEYIPAIDPAVFERDLGTPFRSEYLILTDQTPPIDTAQILPEVGEVSLGPHLGYAGQWFLFAGVVLVGYPLLLRSKAGGGHPTSVSQSEQDEAR